MRLSLKCLLGFIAIVFAVVAHWAEKGREQRDIVAAIRALNGTVVYYFEWTDFISAEGKPEPSSPAWLRLMFGVDFFHSVMSVSLSGSNVTDESLPHLERLMHLESITLRNTAITSRAAEKLRNASVIGLFIDGGALGDADLAWIGAMRQLRFLQVTRAQITDRSLPNLYRLGHGVEILIGGTGVTKEGLMELHRRTGAGITWDEGYIQAN